jgi:hypothetical protein
MDLKECNYLLEESALKCKWGKKIFLKKSSGRTQDAQLFESIGKLYI